MANLVNFKGGTCVVCGTLTRCEMRKSWSSNFLILLNLLLTSSHEALADKGDDIIANNDVLIGD